MEESATQMEAEGPTSSGGLWQNEVRIKCTPPQAAQMLGSTRNIRQNQWRERRTIVCVFPPSRQCPKRWDITLRGFGWIHDLTSESDRESASLTAVGESLGEHELEYVRAVAAPELQRSA